MFLEALLAGELFPTLLAGKTSYAQVCGVDVTPQVVLGAVRPGASVVVAAVDL
eukprot:CAMPEP_0204906756 /NCGR_PEP_ID=MMETSP1397-20131031/6143_1 /ASSEMBLY_ACC=CAM_ASM_000891 /TAXON_ID=49980 /ORGANISM="Climacostomum Climacostomum virens, Strain Stock W-24" /LENGTH=52 /DNA_ID=CAMNT_0052075761 /DNA_START=333 /DNA_END=488 /DNA_ORIENTATION=-